MTTVQVIDPQTLRQVFGAFPSGVTAIAAVVEGEPAGLAASSFTSVSVSPPLVAVCFAHTSTTWPLLRRVARLGVSVLAAGQAPTARQLAARGSDRFAGLIWRSSRDGAVFIEGAAAWLECSVEQQIIAGDHDLALLRVHDLDGDHGRPPLIFHQSRLRGLQP